MQSGPPDNRPQDGQGGSLQYCISRYVLLASASNNFLQWSCAQRFAHNFLRDVLLSTSAWELLIRRCDLQCCVNSFQCRDSKRTSHGIEFQSSKTVCRNFQNPRREFRSSKIPCRNFQKLKQSLQGTFVTRSHYHHGPYIYIYVWTFQKHPEDDCEGVHDMKI